MGQGLDLRSNFTPLVSLPAAVRTADATGTGVSVASAFTNGFEVHHAAWSDGSHTPVFEDSPDGTTFAPCAAEDLVGSAPAMVSATEEGVYVVEYIGDKPYLRAGVTVAGATGGAITSIHVVKGRRRWQDPPSDAFPADA